MKLSLRLFWTKDVCRKPLYVVDNLTGGCFLLPFNLECIQKKKKKKGALGLHQHTGNQTQLMGIKSCLFLDVIWGDSADTAVSSLM